MLSKNSKGKAHVPHNSLTSCECLFLLNILSKSPAFTKSKHPVMGFEHLSQRFKLSPRLEGFVF
ncbi:MAG: hypothetical protein COU46_00175 [Candidatus Niyogibacteria bacterium CG10_big_fil_rev_8_21_14_0_10_42_19]|uniref:Uncharacterized protein n=1 Tax=Candidatus Niyogibacteria bacterium CG10_big_fil_rev_8_21_14_0_10_42_19 TaxID=1974725 RepID=A0A2H0TIB6_9BACT|nr:MAG: hypothetical protein COU46_00175 [Candidatus Niyogibacteria bacterium CG10_big_fil_rev_8_21_14_0_10_42_19]